MEIYAELPKKLQQQLDNGASLRFPIGVTVSRNGRALSIECEEYMIDIVEDLLDRGGITYQEMEERENKDDDDKRSSW